MFLDEDDVGDGLGVCGGGFDGFEVGVVEVCAREVVSQGGVPCVEDASQVGADEIGGGVDAEVGGSGDGGFRLDVSA